MLHDRPLGGARRQHAWIDDHRRLDPGRRPADGATVEISLRPGVYDFEARAETEAGVLIAHGAVVDRQITSPIGVMLPLAARIGELAAQTATPIQYVVPGQSLDLLITVVAPDGVSRVSLSDSVVDYDFRDDQARATGATHTESRLGVRVQTDGSTDLDEFVATAAITGLVETAGGAVGTGSRARTTGLPFSWLVGLGSFLLATRVGAKAALLVMRELSRGAYVLPAMAAGDLAAAADLIEAYPGLDVGVADASTVVLARRYRTREVLTLDRRHFGVLRPLDGGRFTLLP